MTKTERAAMTDAAPPAAAPATDMETQADAPVPTMSPEEQALNTIRTLDQYGPKTNACMHANSNIAHREKQEIIARGWTSTSQRLEELNGRLSETQKELQSAQARLDQTSKENETLKIATKETAAHLVFSRARFI